MNVMENILEPEMTGDGVELDATGKAVLDDIYCQEDPRLYFEILKPLDYSIPGCAQPYFLDLSNRLTRERGSKPVRIIDLGCSYGINSALLKLGIPYERLAANYANTQFANFTRAQFLTRDRKLLDDHSNRGLHMTGVDISGPALEYGVDAGYLDASILADLERHELSSADCQQLAHTDLMISTGCIGYIGAATIKRLLDGMGDARPWSAHFVLRMFSFDEIETVFSDRDYETIRVPGVFKQRQFISTAEKNEIIFKLKSQGIETVGLEDLGYFYAQLYLSIPRCDLDLARELVAQWS